MGVFDKFLKKIAKLSQKEEEVTSDEPVGDVSVDELFVKSLFTKEGNFYIVLILMS